jgi:putative hydrolase of the HAD superfamily
LNWKSLYQSAFEQVLKSCKIDFSQAKIDIAKEIMLKYNTREHYREYEVTSDTIFSEILTCWCEDKNKLDKIRQCFYEYFQTDAVPFDDTEPILKVLKQQGIKTGILTDVAYGMDNKYSLKDISTIESYFDVCLTSVDVGYRKPNINGFLKLSDLLNTPPSQMLYVGDEEKDIIGANRAGLISVLINREGILKEFGQRYTIKTLAEVSNLIAA